MFAIFILALYFDVTTSARDLVSTFPTQPQGVVLGTSMATVAHRAEVSTAREFSPVTGDVVQGTRHRTQSKGVRYAAGDVFVVTADYDKTKLRNWFRAQSKLMSKAIEENKNPYAGLRFKGDISEKKQEIRREIMGYTQNILRKKINNVYSHEIVRNTGFSQVFYQIGQKSGKKTHNQWLREQKIEFASYPQFRRIFREKKYCISNKSVTDFVDYYEAGKDSNLSVYHPTWVEYSYIEDACLWGLFEVPAFYSYLNGQASSDDIVHLGIKYYLDPPVAAFDKTCEIREKRIIDILKKKYDELMIVAKFNGLLEINNTKEFNPNDFSAYRTMLTFNSHQKRSFITLARSAITRDVKWALNAFSWYSKVIAPLIPKPNK